MAVTEIRTNNKGTVVPIDGYRSCHGQRPEVRFYTNSHGKNPTVGAFCQDPSCPLYGSGPMAWPEEMPGQWNLCVEVMGEL